MTNVLIIEDNLADARLIREMLSGGAMPDVRVNHATSLAAALTILEQQPPDAVLLDLGLPDSRGMDTFIAARSKAPNVPIVVLTGFSDEAIGSRTVEQGAQDYLVKGQVDAQGLARAIEYAVRRHGQREELELVASELERRNSELSAFTYSVSHDLKEPLRTIEAFSQFVMEDYAAALDDQGRDYLTRMAAAAARLKQMIDDLLLLTRAGQRPETVGRVEMTEVLDDIVAALNGSITAMGARIDIDPGLPAVLGDRVRVEQIFGNLLSNALKFGREEPPRVRVGITTSDDGGSTFFVQDNGIGIDPRYSERVFHIFQRLHRRDEYEGTGAGLAIVRRAAEALGGRVWLNSTPGEGATFFVSLPLYKASTHLSDLQERVEEAA
jgi:light-regulated signal transduction histidine kinase (bacteriophytochrome)